MGSGDDLPAIVRIQQNSPDAAQWSREDYAGFPLLVAVVDGTPAGFCAWRTVAPGETELLNLAVDPAFRRRGVASALLNGLSRLAQGTLFLEVAASNAAAIALYRGCGWEEAGIRPGYYSQGTINGIVMKKRSW